MKTYRITIREVKLSFFEVPAPNAVAAKRLWEEGRNPRPKRLSFPTGTPLIVESGIFSIHEIIPKSSEGAREL